MTVKQLLDNLDSGEITEWQAHFALEHEERVKADVERQAMAGLNVARRRR